MFRRTISALAIVLASSVTMANESPDLAALLQTILQGKDWGEQAEAIRQVEKLPPSERIVKTLVAVVIDPASDADLRQFAQTGILEQLKHRRDLPAPHDLVAALTSARIQAASREPSNDDSLQTAIKRCITALKAEHDRTRAVKLPEPPDNTGWTLPNTSGLRFNQDNENDKPHFRFPRFNNPSLPKNDDAPTWNLSEVESVPIGHPTSWDGRIDSSLARHAPSLGYVTTAKEFATLWTRWKGDSPTPKIDFDKYIVLAAASQSSSLQLIPELNSKCDLTVKTIATADLTSDHGFILKLVEIQGVKTINSRAITPKSTNKSESR